MNDLLSEMSQDSEDTPDKLDTLNSGKLDGVSRLAQEAALLEQEIAQYEQFVKEKKQALYKITDEPLTLTDGAEISVKPIYAASIPKERKEEAFQWLRDHDFGDLVKNNVTVSFGRGEDEVARDFVDFCDAEGYAPNQMEKVEPMTLKAWLRERVEAGDPVPLDLFGAFISQRATIKRSK